MGLPTIGILSIGEMGLGIARLLLANNYRLRHSETTKDRARKADISLVDQDSDIVKQADYILSIVPPRDALTTAQRITAAHAELERRGTPLWYIDLNAVAPRSAHQIADLFAPFSPQITFLDGGIIGGPPAPKPDNPSEWKKPSLVVSGPHSLADDDRAGRGTGAQLATLLNVRHVANTIGPASGLKMCFASTTKGLTAIAIQSFTTAAQLGVLDELRAHLADHSPRTGALAEAGLRSMPSKAYRWVEEMRQIGATFAAEGGWEGDAAIFAGAAAVYELVAGTEGVGGEKGLEVERVVEGLVGKLQER
ncbi:MAG: hypothetical protein M1821_004778 [Bathelium mastoideum]|nr:MAG: hypothetical protein M1821_004778 [Bathelium mastoideum]